MSNDHKIPELKMDAANLYREEIFTDRKAGTIQRLTPVKTDGSQDTGRAVIYVGQAQLLTAVGALPLSFEIDARSLDEAVKKFPEVARQAVEQAVQELQELRREASSSLIIPGSGSPAPGMGGPGGMQGGGKIRFP